MERHGVSITIGELLSTGEIIEIQDGNHGGSHPKANEYVDEGIPFIMASDIRDGWLNLDEAMRLPKVRTDSLRIGFARSGDVLLTHKGTVGEVAIVPPLSDYVMLTPQVTYYRVDQTKLEPRFLAYVFRSPMFQQQLANSSAQSTRPYIGITSQRRLSVPLCPLPIQRRIASILGAYDDLIEVNRRRIAILEEMARRLFDEWFVHFRFPGHEGHEMVETEHGVLPKGWQWRDFGHLCEEIRDTVNPSDIASETPYVGLEHIPRRSTTLNSWGRLDKVISTKLRFRSGDVLFGKIRPYFHKVVWAPFEGVCSSDAIVIRSRKPEWNGIVVSVSSSNAFVAKSTQTSNGTKMPRANWSVLIRHQVALPPLPLVQKFNECIVSWINLSSKLNTANNRLAASRDLLLPRLISGELSVDAAETALEAAA